jgi:hypothetical protein
MIEVKLPNGMLAKCFFCSFFTKYQGAPICGNADFVNMLSGSTGKFDCVVIQPDFVCRYFRLAGATPPEKTEEPVWNPFTI